MKLLDLIRASFGLGSLLAVAMTLAAADQQPQPDTERKPAGRCVTPPGTLVSRDAPGKRWQVVRPLKDELQSGDLLVGLPGAIIESKNGAVRVAFLTDLEGQSPYPVKECAVVLHQNAKADLDFTLDRGRADLVNNKDKGAAHVVLRVREHVFEISLAEPKARIAFELYGRWPKGVPFTKKPGPKDVPVAEMAILVVKGDVEIKHGACQHALHAPPGPALMHWSSVGGCDETPTRLEKLPEWATVEQQLAGQAKERLERFRKLLSEKSLEAAFENFLDANDENLRRFGVFALAALDNLSGLAKVMAAAKHHDVVDNGVLALRHWLGRGPGQDIMFYNMLIEEGKFPPVQAEIVMQLLHTFGDDDLARPETYELLIDYLDHDKLAIRHLAHWHLVRLVPAGKKFPYQAIDAKEQRDAAIKQWKQLIPPGKLPPKEQPDGK